MTAVVPEIGSFSPTKKTSKVMPILPAARNDDEHKEGSMSRDDERKENSMENETSLEAVVDDRKEAAVRLNDDDDDDEEEEDRQESAATAADEVDGRRTPPPAWFEDIERQHRSATTLQSKARQQFSVRKIEERRVLRREMKRMGCESEAEYDEVVAAGCDSKAQYLAMQELGFDFDEKEAFKECTALGFWSKERFADFTRLGFSTLEDKPAYEECRRHHFQARADYEAFLDKGFKSKEEYDSYRAMGFTHKGDFDYCVSLGFHNKADFDECRTLGFDNKASYDECKQLGFTTKSDYEECKRLGFPTKEEFDAKYNEVIASGSDNRAQYLAMKSMGFDDKASFTECTALGFWSKEPYLEFKRLGFVTLEDKPAFEECHRLGLESQADYALFKEKGFETKAEFDSFRAMGFTDKDDFDLCVSMGFLNKADFDECRALGFDNKAAYDECKQLGFSTKSDYEECKRLGFPNKKEYDAWQEDKLLTVEDASAAASQTIDDATFSVLRRDRDGSVSRRQLLAVTNCDPLRFLDTKSIEFLCGSRHLRFIDARLILLLASQGEPLPTLERIEVDYSSYLVDDLAAEDIFRMELANGGFINAVPNDNSDTIIVVVSMDWLATDHPDPAMVWMPKLAGLLGKYREFWDDPNRLDGRWSSKRVVVWLDYCCLHTIGVSEGQKDAQEAAAALICGHSAVQIWRLPSDGTEVRRQQGWNAIEKHLSGFVTSLVLDLSALDEKALRAANCAGDGTSDEDMVFHEYDGSLGLDFSDTLLEPCHVSRLAVSTLRDFERAIDAHPLRHDMTRELIVNIYRVAMLQTIRFSRTLKWHNREWGEAEMKHIGPVLRLAKTVESLDLSLNFLEEAEAPRKPRNARATVIPDIVCPTLKSLSFANAPYVTHATVLAFARGCGALEALDLENCPLVTDATVLAIAEHCSSTLTFLNLTGCDEITDKCCVEGLASRCGNMETIGLGHCSNLTDKAVVALAKGCALLQKLEVPNVPGLTDVSVLALARSSKKLEFLDVTYADEVTDYSLSQFPEGCTVVGP